jgi:hypothetical protein
MQTSDSAARRAALRHALALIKQIRGGDNSAAAQLIRHYENDYRDLQELVRALERLVEGLAVIAADVLGSRPEDPDRWLDAQIMEAARRRDEPPTTGA